ncbi:MAG: squalene synthase HpnC [Rhodoferax sp.]|nr:squalene synthase HpnC [Rhodoferax sp.]
MSDAAPRTTPDPTTPDPITHYENFPVASWLCPAHLRAPITALYHFARTADDLADEGCTSGTQRLQDLQAYRQALVQAGAAAHAHDAHAAPQPSGHHPELIARWPQVFGPLRIALRDHQLPPKLLHDLLDAFVQDVEKTLAGAGYRTQAELLDYCARSANPVGRLLLHLYGVSDPASLQRSDAICTALQLINFWQDLSVDIPRGRHYVSDADCARFGVARSDLTLGRQTEAVTRLVAACVADARSTLRQGAPLVHRLPGRAGWELRLVVQGGLRILDKIEAIGFTSLTHRPVLRRRDYALMLWRALWM